MSQIKACPICELEDEFTIERLPQRDAFECNCRRCGRYWITGPIGRGQLWKDDPLRPYLSAHTRQSSDRGVVPQLTTKNWEELAEPHKATTSSQKARKLLEYFSSRSRHPGDWVADAPAYDYPLIDAASEQEWHYFVEYLRKLNYLELAPKGVHPPNSYRLTVQGWSKLEPQSAEGDTSLVGGSKPTGTASEDWDVFICHAGEDKEAVVEPLAVELRHHGLHVWYDRWVLRIGDSLRRKIDEGLLKSKYGIVVISSDFFRKRWPQHELDGLVQRELRGERVILPVWHNVNHDEVASYSPTLADKMAGSTSQGVPSLARELIRAMSDQSGRVDRSSPAELTTVETLVTKLQLLKGAAVRITPLIPRPEHDLFTVVEVKTGTVKVEKKSSHEHIHIPTGRIEELLDLGNSAHPTLVLNGRLQWLTLQRKWEFSLDKPPSLSGSTLGIPRDCPSQGPMIQGLSERLRQRGYHPSWAGSDRVPDALSSGSEVFYDDDGFYLRCADPDGWLILLVS